jgi:RND family efflux transporter MFP subunit
LKRHKGKIILALLFAAIAAAAIWWNAADKPVSKKTVPVTTTATSAHIRHREQISPVLATGAVRPQVGAEVRVGSRISGKVEHLYANIGDKVKKGQIIAELEKADLQASAARAGAEVQVAEAKIADADSRLKLAGLEYGRQQNLIKKDFTSRQALDKAVKEKESAEAGLNLAQKELEAARAALKEAEVKLSYATITAPITGVIGSVSTQEGETVAAGLNSPTFVTIIDLNRLQTEAFVDETDIGKVKVGQQAVFTVDTFPDREFEGEVTAIYPKAVIQDNVVNYDVVIGIKTPYQGILRPDMTTSVTIRRRRTETRGQNGG